jgi:hypothetical protein
MHFIIAMHLENLINVEQHNGVIGLKIA